MKTIIIGCGSTMENGYGEDVRSKEDQCGWYAHALHTHSNCTTVNIEEGCSPSLVLDFCTDDHVYVLKKLGYDKFDLIILEDLPTYLLTTRSKLKNICKNSYYISTEICKIIVQLAFEEHVEYIADIFLEYSFKLIGNSHDSLRIYPLISSLAGRYSDEYVLRNDVNMKLWKTLFSNTSYLVFKRF